MFYLRRENKGADQLRVFCASAPSFSLMQNANSLMTRLILLPYWTISLNKKQMGIIILSALPESKIYAVFIQQMHQGNGSAVSETSK